uniref:Dolichyl-diphosphooligosaccharide--protein glycosyltransferase subunit 2 n=1 Tax=Syphacia muris TaxID=451379 RepID=A0A0N5A988_9BILA
MLPLCLVALLLSFHIVNAATPFLNTYLDEQSRESMKNVFEKALNSRDINSLYHGVAGLQMLGVSINNNKQKDICSIVDSAEVKDVVALNAKTSIIKILPNCKIAAVKGAAEMIDAAIKASKPIAKDLYYAISAARNMGIKISDNNLVSLITSSMKDGSTSSLAYGLNAAALLEKSKAEQFLVRIEDLIGQADEVDGKYLQLEGGISITALGIHAIYALADHVNKSPNVKSDEAVKLANYLLSRRGVQMDRAAFLLLKTLKKFAKNNFQVPVSFSLASNMAMSDMQKQIRIRVCNVLGETVGALSVNVDAVTHMASKEIVSTRKQLAHVPDDKTNTLYELVLDGAKSRGFYLLSLTAGSQDKRLVGTNGATILVKLLSKVRVEDVTVAVYDRELSKPTNLNTVKEGSKLGKVFDADTHSKMEIKFVVKEAKNGEPVTVHQAFVVFVHTKTNQEIIFVATPNSARTYTFDLDFSEKVAKEFNGVSGVYSVRLIIGDPAISHALDWNLVNMKLDLPAVPLKKTKKSEEVIYQKRPEIQHMFREPEKRPPSFVSDSFSWSIIGVNCKGMPTSIWVPLFHLCLGAVFGLYLLFWLYLNMFDTLKYLAIIGSTTFITGNRLLRAIASADQEGLMVITEFSRLV